MHYLSILSIFILCEHLTLKSFLFFTFQTYDLISVMTADEISQRGAAKCGECDETACQIWKSDLDTETELHRCLDHGGWPPINCLPIKTLKNDLRNAMLDNCTCDRNAAEAEMEHVPDHIAHKRCICGKTHAHNSPDRFWLECSHCEEWYRVRPICEGVPASEAEAKKNRWYCKECANSMMVAETLEGAETLTSLRRSTRNSN